MKENSVKNIIWAKNDNFNEQEFESFLNEILPLYTMPESLAKILYIRGFQKPVDIIKFFHTSHYFLSSPFLYPDMNTAIERIMKAKESNEKILIFGDSDIDGILGVTILYRTLISLNFKYVFYAIPENEESYGLTFDKINQAKSIGISLIITVDNGISAKKEVAYAYENGIDTIITDHHNPSDKVPNSYALLNPKMITKIPFEHLSGTGVSYKLCEALCFYQTRAYQDEFYLIHLDLFSYSVKGNEKLYLHYTETTVEHLQLTKSKSFTIEYSETADNIILVKPHQKVFSFGKIVSMDFLKNYIEGKYTGKLIITEDKNLLISLLTTLQIKKSFINEQKIKNYTELITIENFDPDFFSFFSTDYPIQSFFDYYRFFSCLRMNYRKIEAFLNTLLPYVSIATIADIMPLCNENRTFVKEGLALLNENKPEFINNIVDELYNLSFPINTTDIIWRVSPLLNSPGRFGKGNLLLNYFINSNLDEAKLILSEIIDLNAKRTAIVEKVVNSITIKQDDSTILLIEKENIESGLTGLLSSRFLSMTGKPVIFVAKNDLSITGSMRSNYNLNSFTFLSELSQFFENFGGHSFACGFTVKKDMYTEFKETITKKIATTLFADAPHIEYIDSDIDFEELNDPNFIEWYKKLEPFGEAFRNPVFITFDVSILNPVLIGRNNNSMKFSVSQGEYIFDAFFFKASESLLKASLKNIYAIIYEIQINNDKIVLTIQDIYLNHKEK